MSRSATLQRAIQAIAAMRNTEPDRMRRAILSQALYNLENEIYLLEDEIERLGAVQIRLPEFDADFIGRPADDEF